jgi:hypothetical protein
MGSRGSQVQKLQKLYNDNVVWFDDPLPLIVEDGIWGPKTNEAVKAMWNFDQVTESWYNEKVTAFTSTTSTASSPKTSEQVYKEYLAGMSANYTQK